MLIGSSKQLLESITLLLPHQLQKQTSSHHLCAGLGASGEGGARAGACPQRRADQTGEAGTDGEKIRQEGCHEGDLAPGEPETGGSGKTSTTTLWILYNGII